MVVPKEEARSATTPVDEDAVAPPPGRGTAAVDRLRERWRRTFWVLRAPRVRIAVYGGAMARDAYGTLTMRHPRFKIVQNKRWGVALLDVPDSFEEYLRGHGRRNIRRKMERATQAGLRYARVTPSEYMDDILEINRSAPVRQGRAMAKSYLQPDLVVASFQGIDSIHAILAGDGRLVAYAVTLDLGDLCAFSLLLGHADDLDLGTMGLLIAEVIHWCTDLRRARGAPRWLMYDTFWGAGAGLAIFKQRCGFRPYTVDWAWVNRAPVA